MACSLGGTAYAFNSAAGASLSSGALDADPPAGATVLVKIAYTFDSTEAVNSVTDNATGNTYTKLTSASLTAPVMKVEVWKCEGIATVAGFAVTVGWNASTLNPNRSVHVVTVVGGGAVDVTGGQTQTNPGTATDAITTGTLGTPAVDGNFVLGATIMSLSPDNVFNGTGYTALSPTGFNNEFTRAEYLIQGTKAAVVATFTQDNGGGLWGTVAVSVAPAGPPSTEQEGSRARNDDGSETTATWKAAQDTDITLASGDAFRARLLLNTTNDLDSKRIGFGYVVNGGQQREVH
jgi:hypothetical protein